jgi:hypothetical protein
LAAERWSSRVTNPIADVLGDYQAFFLGQKDRLRARGIDISPYPLRHLAYRVPEYDADTARYRNLFASCVRDVTSSFRNALRRWYSTVLGLMKRCAAISRFVLPSAARREIWASCAVS